MCKQNVFTTIIYPLVVIMLLVNFPLIAYSATINDGNGTWNTSVTGTGITISYTPDPYKIVCSKIYLSQTCKLIDGEFKLQVHHAGHG
jgi:hypothetical protein